MNQHSLNNALPFGSGSKSIRLRLICPAEQEDAINADIITVPRLIVEFVSERVLLGPIEGAVSRCNATERQAVLTLAAAAHDSKIISVILPMDTFFVRPISMQRLLEFCDNDEANRNGGGRSETAAGSQIGLFDHDLALRALKTLTWSDFELLKRALPNALISAELGLWRDDPSPSRTPLLMKLSRTEWASKTSIGWCPQPWKTTNYPYIVQIIDASSEPEEILPHLYAAFHR